MSPETWQITIFTLGVATLSTLVILPPGLALAWLLARRSWRGKSVVETLVALPLVVPPVATGLILLKLFGRRGPIGQVLEGWFGLEVVFTWVGVVLATAVMSFPLLVRTARVAFEAVDPHLEEVSRLAGANGWQTWWRVTLPTARNGVLAGVLLSFARALGEFGATIMVAGFIPGETATLALSIYHLVQLGRDAEAYGLVAISGLIAFGAVWWGERLARTRA